MYPGIASQACLILQQPSASSNDIAFPGPSSEVFIVARIHTGLLSRLGVERALHGTSEELLDVAPEHLHRIRALFLAYPSKPAMAGRDVRDLVVVDDVQRVDAVQVASVAKLLDR